MTQVAHVPLSHDSKQVAAAERHGVSANVWLYLAIACGAAIIVSAIVWSLAHPYGIHWDEAEYINDARLDFLRFQTFKFLTLGGRILLKSWGRPPAYRIIALPFLAISGFHVTAVRISSLACFALAAYFVYLAGCKIASRAAGAFAAILFLLAPEVVGASIFFSTDAPLFLATAAMLYFLFALWSDPAERTSSWVGLGCALGLGLWAKVSFLALGGPVVAFALLLALRRSGGILRMNPIYKACGLAAVIGLPWWGLNLRSAISYADFTRGDVRNSLGAPSIITVARWLNTAVLCLVGPAITVLIAIVLVAFVRRVVTKHNVNVSPLQKLVLVACALTFLPILVAQLTGTNDLLRHISPIVIPLAISVGILADRSGWTDSMAGVVMSAALICIQLGMLVYPVLVPNRHPVEIGFSNGTLPWRTMERFEQWDWGQLLTISRTCGVATPQISFLGGGRVFDPPHIQFPWVSEAAVRRRDKFEIPDAIWLWRFEQGPIDWQKVMEAAEKSDIVITAPEYAGESLSERDNMYNSEFAERLAHDSLFQAPMKLEMGRFTPVEVLVFVKRVYQCTGVSAARMTP